MAGNHSDIEVQDRTREYRVYIYNFPPTFQPSNLVGILKAYGTIAGIEVLTTKFPDDISKLCFDTIGTEYVYAVVKYGEADGVKKAITSLHGQMIYEGQSKPLIVSSVPMTGNQLMYVTQKTVHSPVVGEGGRLLEMSAQELQRVGEIESQLSPLAKTNQYYLAINSIRNTLIEIQNYLLALPQYISQLVSSMPQVQPVYQYPLAAQTGVPQRSPFYGQLGAGQGAGKSMQGPISGSFSAHSTVSNFLGDSQSFHSGISSVSSTPSVSSVSTVSSNARGPPGANIFVYHLPNSVGNDELNKLFSPFGSVLSTRVYKDPTTGESKGFGFVSYTSPESANRAILQMNGYHIENKRLKVELKKE